MAGDTRTALITGANRGIGLCVAQNLARQGMKVVLGCRSRGQGEEIAAELGSGGCDARVIALDLAGLAHARVHIDVLVNNAGIYRRGTCLTVPMPDMRESMEVHFFGPLALCQALVPGMVDRAYGRVVNVSSRYGSFGDALLGDAAYSLSKAALNALTLKLSGTVNGDVKVNAVCPGSVRTRMGGADADRSVEEGADTIGWLATLPASGPTGGFFRDRSRFLGKQNSSSKARSEPGRCSCRRSPPRAPPRSWSSPSKPWSPAPSARRC
jgi:NAD(P)-dependent dehydrogenase (short-subunit alcohol dehydrogenase family)